MTITRANVSGWAAKDQITATQINHIDTENVKGIDGTSGGSYAPSALIDIAGLGVEVSGPFEASSTTRLSGTTSFTGVFEPSGASGNRGARVIMLVDQVGSQDVSGYDFAIYDTGTKTNNATILLPATAPTGFTMRATCFKTTTRGITVKDSTNTTTFATLNPGSTWCDVTYTGSTWIPTACGDDSDAGVTL